jgi:hypothetical protein
LLNEQQTEIITSLPVDVQPVVHDSLPLANSNTPIRQAGMPPNADLDGVEALRTSLRTLRLSNDGLSLLLERNQAELAESRARITHLEEHLANFTHEMAQEVSSRLLAEGIAVDLNSQLIIVPKIQPFIDTGTHIAIGISALHNVKDRTSQYYL